ncbi:MAG: Rossmann-fold NAD(P)-binding domain-containing protein [Terriglobales bacterium]
MIHRALLTKLLITAIRVQQPLAAKDADALPLAVHWPRIGDVLKPAGDLSGKIFVNCSLPMNAGN